MILRLYVLSIDYEMFVICSVVLTHNVETSENKLCMTAVAPERIWKWGAQIRRDRSAGKKFLGRAPPLFGSKSTISRFGERFRDGQYSLVSFLFAVLLLTVPPVPSHL